MPETISKTDTTQIIGGVFANRANADNAVQELRELGVPDENIQGVVMLQDDQARQGYTDAMVGRGIAESQALFYDKAIRSGKILVAVHNVTDAAKIIEVFDDNRAEYNPDGSRNLRDDVAGMTEVTVIETPAAEEPAETAAKPMVQPILIGEAATEAEDKKRGWWRR